MQFPVTALYALPLGMMCLILWFRVTKTRASMKVSIGDNGNILLLEKIRQHGNFIEWVPLVLIVMVLAEGNGVAAVWLHVTGTLLVLGRTLHPFGLKADNLAHRLRIAGNSMTLLSLVIVMISLAMKTFEY